jgi:hypothetical protein
VGLLHTLFERSSVPANGDTGFSPITGTVPALLSAAGVTDFALASALRMDQGLPTLDWSAINAWLRTVPDAAEQVQAFTAAQRTWLAYLRDALGPGYHLMQHGDVLLLSSLEPIVAQAALDFMACAAQHIQRVLDGLTQRPNGGYDILIVLDDEDTYDRYVARYCAEGGGYAASGGMFIQEGCGHFVTCKADLNTIEPIIVNLMTHGYLAHLALPLWLNEGLVVNTKYRLSSVSLIRGVLIPIHAQNHSVMQQHDQEHRRYWNAERMQQFWSGRQFHVIGAGQTLAYNLATLLVGQFARDWDCFRAFVLAAKATDAGQTAAVTYLGLGLGDAVSALLERPDMAEQWQPAPERWSADAAENSTSMRAADSGADATLTYSALDN